ncbi:hypothetical protein BKA62DRAFT_703711 [Auriculariales sp. MPI-PUGE-AT-0066]|nr:hypothetical protein BKA62DRAFT_703711 [Auriculariales sp. MPI-PUGE-AT-0066]
MLSTVVSGLRTLMSTRTETKLVAPYIFDTARQEWVQFSRETHSPNPAQRLPHHLHLISWNIDFSREYADGRAVAAIDALRDHILQQNALHRTASLTSESHRDTYATKTRIFTISSDPDNLFPQLKNTGDVVFHADDAVPDLTEDAFQEAGGMLTSYPLILQFQEVDRYAQPHILAHPWIKKHFLSSKRGPDHYSSYFTMTLVDRRLAPFIFGYRSVPLPRTDMARDVLLFDLLTDSSSTPSPTPEIVRFANTHLESLNFHKKRPEQLQFISQLMKQPNVSAAFLSGDFNPIAPDDNTLVETVGLRDLWTHRSTSGASPQPTTNDVQNGHGEVAELEQQTWGYWPRSEFPPRRFDKICASGSGKLAFGRVARVAVGSQATFEELTDPEADPNSSPVPPETVWVSDHMAVEAYLSIL